jgi:transposase-like protein
MNLLELSALTDDQVREYLEKVRWPKGAVCAHCGSKNARKLEGKATRPGVYKCRECRKQFTVTVGTVMHRSHISLKHWILGFHLMAASKKGISAHQLHRMFGITYKSAWHMAHRIRHAMHEEPLAQVLRGKVEVDETYVGGKAYNLHASERRKPRASGGADKIPVVALVERDGRVRSRVVANVGGRTLRGLVRETVRRDSTIITDQFGSYEGVGAFFKGGHESVNHSAGEYVRGDIHTNTVESYFAILKRGVTGVFHHVSREHMDKYLSEFAFRWNGRKMKDSERRDAAIRAAEGKRLTYRAPKKR